MTHRDRQTSLPGFEPEPAPEPEPEPEPKSSSPRTARTCHPTLTEPGRPAGPPPQSLEGKTVWVIDSHSLIYQVFHALPNMAGPRGEPVGAVFGFTRDLLDLLQKKKPDYLFCAFDLPGKTFRHEMYDQYKAQRKEMPEDLRPQIESIRRVIGALGIPALACESYEADDVLATIARITDELGGQCIVVTGDKDCRQLITDRVMIYNIRKDEVFDRDALLQKWGIAPEQVVDFQALVGDASDNVPGVPLIGPKFAQQLLEKFGTLDDVLDAALNRADEISGAKRKENLVKYRDQAELSRKLVRLDVETPVEIDWPGGEVGEIHRTAAQALFREFGFRNMGERLDALQEMSGEARPPALEVEYRLVDTPELLETFVAEMRRQKCISLDTETTDVRPRWAEIVGYSFAWRDNEAWYLPVRAPEGERCLDPKTTLEVLRPILEDPEIEKIGQNLKYDMIVLRSAGVELAGVAFDTMVADYLLEAGRRGHNLDELASRYLGHTTTKITELIGTGKNQKRMDEVPVAQVVDYAGEDAMLPLRLRPILAKSMEETGVNDLFTNLELPLIDVLVEIEHNGIRVDVERLSELSRRYGRRIDELEETIFELAGHPLNIASPKQLQQVLFTELELPIIKKTKTGPSTDASVLEELARVHPLPAKIIEYRQYAKLKSTYVDALPEMVYPGTGRVHASFNQVVTATGRLSSSDPNLQNIPVRTDAGREIRSAFIPEGKDSVLLAADYSQIELRFLAHFSSDERLCEAFARGDDIHAQVAGQVNQVPLEEVTADMRRDAKAVNFGVIYGQSAFGLAKSLGIEQDAAAQFIDSYFEGYPGIGAFLDEVLAKCRKNGYVSTILGRRRAISGVRDETARSRAGRQTNLAERTAVNTVIQGSAADLIKV
ncbi:MAG: DNA polymerase I, partial [Thermoguttaceae bacterium]